MRPQPSRSPITILTPIPSPSLGSTIGLRFIFIMSFPFLRRWWIGVGWVGSSGMLDPPHWADEAGEPAGPADAAGWAVLHDSNTDIEGWQYATGL